MSTLRHWLIQNNERLRVPPPDPESNDQILSRREHSYDSYDIGMKLAPDLEAASWLDGLAGEPKDFEWDAGNRAKNRTHEVEPKEVEAMFRRPRFVVFAGRIVAPADDEPRWLVLGQDDKRRRLALVLPRRGNRLLRSVAGQ